MRLRPSVAADDDPIVLSQPGEMEEVEKLKRHVPGRKIGMPGDLGSLPWGRRGKRLETSSCWLRGLAGR
jgi:hypothetical protein